MTKSLNTSAAHVSEGKNRYLMDQEVKDILDLMEEISTRNKVLDSITETKIEKILGLTSLISLIATFAFMFFKSTQYIGLAFAVIFLFSFLGFAIFQCFYTISIIKNPLKGYATIAESRINRRAEYIEHLSSFNHSALAIVVSAIEADVDRIRKTLGTLVGAINKAGFIPAILALYYASLKITSNTDSTSALILMAFVFGLYIGSFLGNRLANILEYNLSCLKEACEIASNKIKPQST